MDLCEMCLCEMCLSRYVLPACFNDCFGHRGGNLKDCKEFKDTIKMHKFSRHCYTACLKLPT